MHRMTYYPLGKVLYFMSEKALQLCSGSEYDKVRATCIWAWCEWTESLDEWGLMMGDVTRAQRAGNLFLVSYQYLANASLQAGTCLYKVRTKHHYFQHTVRRLSLCKWNPKRQQCILEEDFLGKLKRIASKTARNNMPKRLLQRYMIYMFVRWRRRASAGTWIVPGL